MDKTALFVGINNNNIQPC